MERNLYILNNFPFFPTRRGVSAKIGPEESNLIAITTREIMGEKRIRRKKEKIISVKRLAVSYTTPFFTSLYDIVMPNVHEMCHQDFLQSFLFLARMFLDKS